VNLKGRSLLTLATYSKEEVLYLINLASYLKKKKQQGKRDLLLEGKNIVLIFDKSSTRTRSAFEVASFDEGANVTFLTNSQMGKKESVEDTAKVLGRYYDAIEYRGSEQQVVETLAKYSQVPTYNGLTDDDHPTQVLADFLTVKEKVNKPFEKIKFVYVGDGRNNMAKALMIGSALLGVEFVISSPKALQMDKELIDYWNQKGGNIKWVEDPDVAVVDSDVIYTDVWFSMGEESQIEQRIELLKNYQVNKELIEKSGNENLIFLHCLPAFHDTNTIIGKEVYEKYNLTEMEVSDEVFRGKHSVVFDQAENRVHTIKAVMVATLSDKNTLFEVKP